jgi:site-specific DNA-methyltransferase (adenine-specific)
MKPYYQDDAVTIYHGDCFQVIKEINNIDAVVADPPYGIGYKPQKHNSKKGWGNRNFCATDRLFGDTGKLDFNPSEIFLKYKQKPQIWWGANNYADCLPRSRGWLVWYKADGMEKTDFGHAELAWTNINIPIRGINYLWMGAVKKGERNRSVHPTQKPIQVTLWVLSFLPKSEMILDPFMGSGTTLRAAKDLGRKAIGIEIEEKYCEIAAKRMRQEVLNLG